MAHDGSPPKAAKRLVAASSEDVSFGRPPASRSDCSIAGAGVDKSDPGYLWDLDPE